MWRRSRTVFDSWVVGPHFAQICRDWALRFAAPATFPTIAGRAGGRSGILLSVGLARWNEVMDVHHQERLRHILTLLDARGEDVSQAGSACYSGAGFGPELRAAEERGEVVLVSLDRLYHGQ
ncbi:hypothetical protein [Actinacidiphila soli]|uniref:hypothetical protein n=1 Tax=Actinacidiphila soli TaxID=2487275 RepID=UPI002AFE3357|nr:hypothetical protein [Actinacidiphila soli]